VCYDWTPPKRLDRFERIFSMRLGGVPDGLDPQIIPGETRLRTLYLFCNTIADDHCMIKGIILYPKNYIILTKIWWNVAKLWDAHEEDMDVFSERKLQHGLRYIYINTWLRKVMDYTILIIIIIIQTQMMISDRY